MSSGRLDGGFRPDITEPTDLSRIYSEIHEQMGSLRLERGIRLCLRSTLIALGSAAQAGAAAFVLGGVAEWYCLHETPPLVLSAHQGVTLSLVGAVFVLALVGGLAGYVSARLSHPRSIRYRGKIRASGVGLVLMCIVGAGLALSLRPWSFPSVRVVVVPPLKAALYLERHDVTRGEIVYQDDKQVGYLQTNLGQWIETTVAPSAIATVIDDIPMTGLMSPEQVLQAIGDGSPRALKVAMERLWIFVGVLMIWVVVATTIQRRLWRKAPWPVPGPKDASEAIEWAQGTLIVRS